jgi:hypothetical protein
MGATEPRMQYVPSGQGTMVCVSGQKLPGGHSSGSNSPCAASQYALPSRCVAQPIVGGQYSGRRLQGLLSAEPLKGAQSRTLGQYHPGPQSTRQSWGSKLPDASTLHSFVGNAAGDTLHRPRRGI